MTAIDTSEIITGKAHQLADAGIVYVGIYLRPDRCTKEMIEELHQAGIKVFSICERGEPTAPPYFTAQQGTDDGHAAADFADEMGQPSETTISPAVDYDSDPADVKAYLEAFHNAVKGWGYRSLPYGNGSTLAAIIAAGFASGGWLSQSQAFSGYREFLPDAAIIQGPSATVCGLDCDRDEVVKSTILEAGVQIGVCW